MMGSDMAGSEVVRADTMPPNTMPPNTLPLVIPNELDVLASELQELDRQLGAYSLSIEARLAEDESLSAAVWQTSQEMEQVRSNLSDKK